MLVRRQMRGQLGRVVDGGSHHTVSPQPLDEAIPVHFAVAEADRQQPGGGALIGAATRGARVMRAEFRRWKGGASMAPSSYESRIPEYDVRFGSLADITARSRHVRFTPDSGHSSVQVGCPKSARSGHRCPAVIPCSSRQHKFGHRPSCRGRSSRDRAACLCQSAATSRWSLLSFPRWHSP